MGHSNKVSDKSISGAVSIPRLTLLHLNFLFLASIIQLAVWLAVFGCGLMAVNLCQIGSDICAFWNHRWRVVVRLGSLFKHRLQPLPQIVRFQFVKSRQILTKKRELLQIPMPDGAHHVQTVKDWIRTNWKIEVDVKRLPFVDNYLTGIVPKRKVTFWRTLCRSLTLPIDHAFWILIMVQ